MSALPGSPPRSSRSASGSPSARGYVGDRRVQLGLAMLGLLTLGALLGPLLAPGDPIAIGDVMNTRLRPPLSTNGHGGLHVLGTDAFGRDVLARVWIAARLSLGVGVAGSLLAGAIGVLLGALGAWSGGIVDRVLLALGDALLAIPRLVLLLVIAALWGPGLPTVVTVLALTGWMGVARLVRSEVLGVQVLPYVEAAVALGMRPRRVLWRHVRSWRSRWGWATPSCSRAGCPFLASASSRRRRVGGT
jgi:peptide/nickel transport system permease protein